MIINGQTVRGLTVQWLTASNNKTKHLLSTIVYPPSGAFRYLASIPWDTWSKAQAKSLTTFSDGLVGVLHRVDDGDPVASARRSSANLMNVQVWEITIKHLNWSTDHTEWFHCLSSLFYAGLHAYRWSSSATTCNFLIAKKKKRWLITLYFCTVFFSFLWHCFEKKNRN